MRSPDSSRLPSANVQEPRYQEKHYAVCTHIRSVYDHTNEMVPLFPHHLFPPLSAPPLVPSRLATFLPLPVDSTKGVAKWDAANETLAVTLPIAADPLL